MFSQFQGFQVFFSQFFGCFSRFFGKIFACFQGSSKKFHHISTYRFRNFRTNLNIRRFSDTKMGDLSHFDTAENFLCNKLSFQGFPLKKYLFFKVFKATWSDFKVFKVFKVRQPPCVKFRSQSRETASKRKPYRGLGTR